MNVIPQTMRDEWHQLTKVAISICDDYLPEVLMSVTKDNPRMPRSGSDSAVRIDHVLQDQDTFVVRKSRATRNPLEAEVNRQTWRDQGQAHYAEEWLTREAGPWDMTASKANSHEEDGITGHLGCFLKGQKKQARDKGHDLFAEKPDDEEPGKLVCNMIGQGWEKLPFPVIIDSGACASVMHTEWCSDIPIHQTRGSESG